MSLIYYLKNCWTSEGNFRIGMEHYHNHHYIKAIKYFDKAVQLQSEYAIADYYIGMSYISLHHNNAKDQYMYEFYGKCAADAFNRYLSKQRGRSGITEKAKEWLTRLEFIGSPMLSDKSI